MIYHIQIFPRTLIFKQPAGTSRGIYTRREVTYLKITDTASGKAGIGECALLPQLSCDDRPDFQDRLQDICREIAHNGSCSEQMLTAFPSIRFGLETAFLHLNAQKGVQLFDTPFTRGEKGIRFNGLVWMGTFDEMFARLQDKIAAGFSCVKFKIGAIDFDQELNLLKHIRSHFPATDMEIRVDANGAFHPDEALTKLEQLSKLNIHSIEQPIRAGQWKEMARICRETPIPIALDEELIGIHEKEEKEALIETIRPHYLVLKPSLHGGLKGSDEWIDLASQQGIDFWATSALESNVGLNAIAQWCSTRPLALPQGLGTGQLFTKNLSYPLKLKGEEMWFDPHAPLPDFDNWLNI